MVTITAMRLLFSTFCLLQFPLTPSNNCSLLLAGESFILHPKALGQLGDSTSGAPTHWNLWGLEGAWG